MASDVRGREDRSWSGFTLIELLVVVAIISLMMAMMLPSLTRAQKQGEQIHCLANQHQLYLGWSLFSTDNDDRLCPPETYNSSLKPYLPLPDVFVCKTQASDSSRGTPLTDSYGISNTMGGAFRDGVQPYERFHQIRQASDCMVFADRSSGGARCYWPLLRNSGNKRWLWRPPDLFGVGGITNRHSNGHNMTFADDHGEMIRWKDERTLKLIRGTIADEVAASDNNSDLDYLARVLVGGIPVKDVDEDQVEKRSSNQ